MNENRPQLNWYQLAARAITKHVYLKSIGTTLFIAVFFGAYFYLLKHPAYPTTVMPITQLDHWVGFQPQALPIYLTLWVYVSLPPAFFSTRRELYGYGAAMALMCLTALIIFYIWPTAVPVANIDWAQYPNVDFLKNVDASGNACPSLHVATAFFSGIWLHYLLRRFGAPPSILIINSIWCVAIIYSTIAIRQHVAVDIWAGLALAGVAGFISLRYRTRSLLQQHNVDRS